MPALRPAAEINHGAVRNSASCIDAEPGPTVLVKKVQAIGARVRVNAPFADPGYRARPHQPRDILRGQSEQVGQNGGVDADVATVGIV